MIETILKSLFVGFGIYTLILLLFKQILSKPTKIEIEKFDNSACTIIPVIGLIYLINWVGTLFLQYSNIEDPTEVYQMKNRLFGSYWFGYWLAQSLFLSSQLLWFKKLRKITWIRILIALTFIVSIESILVHLTSLHREYLPSSWSMSLSAKIVEWIYSLGIFSVVSITFHQIKKRS